MLSYVRLCAIFFVRDHACCRKLLVHPSVSFLCKIFVWHTSIAMMCRETDGRSNVRTLLVRLACILSLLGRMKVSGCCCFWENRRATQVLEKVSLSFLGIFLFLSFPSTLTRSPTHCEKVRGKVSLYFSSVVCLSLCLSELMDEIMDG